MTGSLNPDEASQLANRIKYALIYISTVPMPTIIRSVSGVGIGRWTKDCET